jgi:hypothetical protein
VKRKVQRPAGSFAVGSPGLDVLVPNRLVDPRVVIVQLREREHPGELHAHAAAVFKPKRRINPVLVAAGFLVGAIRVRLPRSPTVVRLRRIRRLAS